MPHLPPRTLRQAKADFKNRKPTISEAEHKRLERLSELNRRAEELQERGKKRRLAQKRRKEQEHREKDARRKMGVGLATQLAGFSHTQKRMRGAMERFVGKSKAVPVNPSVHTVEDSAQERDAQSEIAPQQLDLGDNLIDDDDLLDDFIDVIEDSKVTPNCKRALGEGEPLQERKPASTDSNQHTDHCPASTLRNTTEDHKEEARAVVPPKSDWEDLIASGTQLARELEDLTSTSPTATIRAPVFLDARLPEEGTEDDMKFLPAANGIDYSDITSAEVIVRDFAYVVAKPQSAKALTPARTETIIQHYEHVAVSSSKIEGRFGDFGLSTQILYDACGDTDTESDDFSEQPNQTSEAPDTHTAMSQPQVSLRAPFKITNAAHASDPGPSSMQTLGWSTQFLHDAIEDDVDLASVHAGSSFGPDDFEGVCWADMGI